MSIKMEGKFEAALSRIDAIIVKLRQPCSQPLNVPWYPTGHPQIPIEEVTNPNLISTSLKGTPVKLKFPKFPFFKEGDPREWICEIEKCFDFYEIPGVHEISESQKLNCATLHLRGRASQWFHRHIKPQIHEVSWSLFLEELIDQFDSTELGDSNTSVVVDEVKVSDVVSCGKNRDGVVFDCLMNLEMEDYSGEKSSEVFDEMQNQEGEGEVKVVIVEPVVRVMVEGDINRQEINKLFQLHFVKTAWAILSCAQSVKTKSQSRCSKGKGTYLQLKEFLNMSSLTVCKNASEKFLLLWFRWWEEYRGVKIVKEFVGATVREFNFLISISINDGLYRMGAVFSHLTVNRRVKNALVSVYSTHGSMENAVFYVASPEACAAILWKSAKASPKAAEKLKMTATELCKLQIADGVIPEPLGGAHADPSWTSQQIKRAVVEAMDELLEMYTPKLLNHRNLKFRKLGGFIEGETIDPVKKINMKAKEELLIPDEELAVTSVVDIKHEVEKLKEQILDSKEGSSSEAKSVAVDKLVEKLNKEVNQEISKAAEFMGLRDQLDMIRNEMVKANCSSDSNLKNRIEKFNQEFGQGLAGSPNYGNLIHKLTVLKELAKMQKSMPLKQELNKRLKEVMNNPDVKEKIEKLKEEISNSGVSNAADLDDGLKEKILMVKKEIASGVSKTLKSMNLDIELVADINIGYEDIVNTQVLALNGKPVKNLKELAAMVESCSEEFLQFDLEYQQLVVLETKTAKAATPDILTTHCIPSAMSDELKT